MAIMYPEHQEIFAAASEREMYERLRLELPDDVRVYYSVSWNSDSVSDQFMGEGDFIILDPNFGFIVLEVKGGYKIDHSFGKWSLWETPSKYRILNKSPYEQARVSMHTFVKKYQEKYNELFPATYAFAVCFPHYNVDHTLCPEMNETNTICQCDIQDNKLWDTLRKIFFAHRKGSSCTESLLLKLDTLFRGETYSRISAGNIVNSNNSKFSELGYIQTACLDMLSNYHQAMIVGSAGTGKTRMAIQKAIECSNQNMHTLYVCFNKLVSLSIAEELKPYQIDCFTFHKLVRNLVGDNTYKQLSMSIELPGVLSTISSLPLLKYDAIIVDEAQDFNEEWALTLRYLLKDESNSVFYVFYDEDQNIFHRNFGEAFLIDSAPFLLRRNLRNTENIWSFVTSQTGLGLQSYCNNIVGINPKQYPTKSQIKLQESFCNLVRTIVAEGITPSSIILLSDRKLINSPLKGINDLSGYLIVDGTEEPKNTSENTINYYTVQSFKGLDSKVVICLLSSECDSTLKYVAFSRAQSLLYIYEFNADRY